MEGIKLNDLLNIDIDSEEFKSGRITLNTEYNGERHIDSWLKRDEREDKYGPDFSFWARSPKTAVMYGF